MKPLFFIEIPTQPPSEELKFNWYKKELDNDSSGCDDIIEIKNNSLNCDVVLILSGFNITQKQITSKIKNRKKLELSIAYELEEQLSAEIESLFFAYKNGVEKNSLDVVVINREWFENWLAFFNRQEIILTAVISDVMLLKTLPQPFLLVEKSGCFLLKLDAENYVIDYENIGYVLNKLTKELPEELLVISENNSIVELPETSIKLKLMPLQQCLLKTITEYYHLTATINLLQGIYQPKLKNDWKKITWVSIVLVTLLLAGSGFQAYQHWQLTQKETKLDQQREAIFKKNFPGVRVVNPLSQMKTKLKDLQQNQQQQDKFINLLGNFSVALREMLAENKTHLQTIEFDNGVLVVKLNVDSLEMMNQIKQRLTQQQLMVEILSSDKVENQFNASFKISGGNE